MDVFWSRFGKLTILAVTHLSLLWVASCKDITDPDTQRNVKGMASHIPSSATF